MSAIRTKFIQDLSQHDADEGDRFAELVEDVILPAAKTRVPGASHVRIPIEDLDSVDFPLSRVIVRLRMEGFNPHINEEHPDEVQIFWM